MYVSSLFFQLQYLKESKVKCSKWNQGDNKAKLEAFNIVFYFSNSSLFFLSNIHSWIKREIEREREQLKQTIISCFFSSSIQLEKISM